MNEIVQYVRDRVDGTFKYHFVKNLRGDLEVHFMADRRKKAKGVLFRQMFIVPQTNWKQAVNIYVDQFRASAGIPRLTFKHYYKECQ